MIDAAFQGTLQQTIEGIIHHPNQLFSSVSLLYSHVLSDGTAINMSMAMPNLPANDWIQTFDVTGSIVKPPGSNGQFKANFSLQSISGSTNLIFHVQWDH